MNSFSGSLVSGFRCLIKLIVTLWECLSALNSFSLVFYFYLQNWIWISEQILKARQIGFKNSVWKMESVSSRAGERMEYELLFSEQYSYIEDIDQSHECQQTSFRYL